MERVENKVNFVPLQIRILLAVLSSKWFTLNFRCIVCLGYAWVIYFQEDSRLITFSALNMH